jgi:hypothetical protein
LLSSIASIRCSAMSPARPLAIGYSRGPIIAGIGFARQRRRRDG